MDELETQSCPILPGKVWRSFTGRCLYCNAYKSHKMLNSNGSLHARDAISALYVGLARIVSSNSAKLTLLIEQMASKAPTIYLHSPIRCSSFNSPVLRCFAPSIPRRYASGLSRNDSKARDQPKKKKKQRSEFKNQSLQDALQFSLCDAMR